MQHGFRPIQDVYRDRVRSGKVSITLINLLTQKLRNFRDMRIFPVAIGKSILQHIHSFNHHSIRQILLRLFPVIQPVNVRHIHNEIFLIHICRFLPRIDSGGLRRTLAKEISVKQMVF